MARPYRRQGVTVALLRTTAAFAKARGGTILEGYPVRARAGRMPDTFARTGLPRSFLAAGFTEVTTPSPSWSIMRLELGLTKKASRPAKKASSARTARAKGR